MISEAKILKIFFLVCSLLLAGCLRNDTQEDVKEIKGDVFGSYYLIKYRGTLDEKKFNEDLNNFFSEFNNQFSTYHQNSLISQFNNQKAGIHFKVTPQFIEMLNLARKFNLETNGAFDPTLGPVIKLWGFGGGKTKKTPTTEEIKAAMSRVGFSHLKWDEKELTVWKDIDGLHLDVNAFAPGWACDLIGKLLQDHNISHYMIDISGEILFKGSKSSDQSWVAGIEKPAKAYAEGIQLAFKMKNQAISTSGNYRQFFNDQGVKRSHIIDPRTGNTVTHLISSASVIADTAVAADAWSTAMMVLGTEGMEISEKHGIKVLLLEAKKPDEFTEITSPSMQRFITDHRL